MGRLMGLDFGSKTTGVAWTDPMKVIVSPLETITREKEGKIRPTLRRITELVLEQDVEQIVVGNPLHMDDSESELSQKSREFA